jgi:hypothetical protein
MDKEQIYDVVCNYQQQIFDADPDAGFCDDFLIPRSKYDDGHLDIFYGKSVVL